MNEVANEGRPYNIEWLGFQRASEPKHNSRIWGYLKMHDGRIYTFWGVHKKGLNFKCHHEGGKLPVWRFPEEDVKEIQRKMLRRNYKEIAVEHYELLDPDFMDRLEVDFMTVILSDNLR